MPKLQQSTPVSDLFRVGKTTASRLKKLGINTCQDLIFYYPFRYDDFSRIVPIAELSINETASIRGKIEIINNRRSPRKHIVLTEALITDDSGSIKTLWFNQPFIKDNLKVGEEVYLAGKLEESKYGVHLPNPSYEKVGAEQTHTARLVPIYSVTERLTQKQIRSLIKIALPLAEEISDWLPSFIKKELNFINLSEALQHIHFPTDKKMLKQARQRLKFDELFLIQCQALKLKNDIDKQKAISLKFRPRIIKQFVRSLPFELTSAQRKAAWEILQNLEKDRPMNRLLEGDVGSGKTIVAALAILNTVKNNHQAVYMAPTEVLAKQQFNNIIQLFKKHKINIALLTNSYCQSSGQGGVKDYKGRQKSNLIKLIKKGEIKIAIGTHALIQENISFKKLALAIIDEQHRFGVAQRKMLRDKSGDRKTTPHLLSMTATPIPRSLALVLYGDLDLSVIDQLPPGRKKILTKIVAPKNRQKAYEFIKKEINKGRQIFVICPLIEESDVLGVKSATQEYEKLKKQVFPELSIGLLHGKLKSDEKEKVMQQFKDNNINILVSTAVVEVGVDIPNATIMMIEGADRFGLAQLHQFRGRVGRSKYQSYCLLFTDSVSESTQARLQALVDCKNSFDLAEKDLEIRGPGEIYGIRQSGLIDLKIASLKDRQLIKISREYALKLIEKDPELAKFSSLKKKIEQLNSSVHLE